MADIKLYASYRKTYPGRWFVYFLQMAGMPEQLIKIGFSKDPDVRCNEIQFRFESDFACRLSRPLEVLATIAGGREVETYVHMAFMKFWIRNEWFEPVPELLALIAELQTLPRPDVPVFDYNLSEWKMP